MRIVITGAGGFLGTKLIDGILNATNYEVTAVTSQVGKIQNKYAAYGQRIQAVQIASFVQIDWKESDLLLNCAFPIKADGVQMARGLQFISDVISQASHNGAGAVINISSQSVYSQMRGTPATERTEVNPENQYALGKYATELLTMHICNANTAHTNIRLASLIGPELEQRLVNKFIVQAMEGRRLHIVGGDQRFGFLDARDAVEGILKLFDSNPGRWREVYNLGTNESYTLTEIAQCVCVLSAEYCEKAVSYEVEPSDMIKNSALDCTAFQKEFGWMPKYTLTDMVRYIFEKKKEGEQRLG